MQIRFIFAAAFGAAAFFSMIRAALVWNEIIEEINTMALPGDRVPDWVGRGPANRRWMDLHRQFYPESPLRKRLRRLQIAIAVLVLAAVACVIAMR